MKHTKQCNVLHTCGGGGGGDGGGDQCGSEGAEGGDGASLQSTDHVGDGGGER